MRSAVLSVVLLGVVLLACGPFVAAQNPNSGNSGTKTTQTIRGCLTKTGNTYVILGGTPMRQYRIIGGDIAAFKGKQNKTVEVTGLVGEKESGASTNGQYGPGSTTGVGYDTIIAKSVKVVVDNCG